jgi:hypothetical protein
LHLAGAAEHAVQSQAVLSRARSLSRADEIGTVTRSVTT